MPTQITQIDDEPTSTTTFRIDGEMLLADAQLVGKIALESQLATGHRISIDLADVDFLDSESASFLKRLEEDHGFAITGTEIFLQNAVNAAEKL